MKQCKRKLLFIGLGVTFCTLFLVSNFGRVDRILAPTLRSKYSTGTVTPQVFWAPSNISSVCIPQETLMDRDKNTPTSKGLLFVRIPKTGSSTTAGVAARIAYKMANKYYNTTTNTPYVCKSRMTHAWSTRFLHQRGSFANRSLEFSFLWTMLRDPAKRAMSSFYYFRVRDNNIMDPVSFLKQPLQHNHVLKWVGAKDDSPHSIQQVLSQFNFIGLFERLDESLVLLQLLLKLKPQDVLYMDAKQSGMYDALRHGCKATPVNEASPKVQAYVSSPTCYKENRGDYMLYNAVNRSIYATIDHVIGRETFQQALATFRQVKARANAHCEYKSPCIAEGVRRPKNEPMTKCYHEDWTCGYECLDNLFHNTNENEDGETVLTI